jgi:hypothetical protein
MSSLRLNLRNRGDSCSNLSTLDFEMCLPNDSSFRRDGCLVRMLHFLHTEATHWQRSLTLSRENIWSISSAEDPWCLFVSCVILSQYTYIILVFRAFFLLILRIILLLLQCRLLHDFHTFVSFLLLSNLAAVRVIRLIWMALSTVSD